MAQSCRKLFLAHTYFYTPLLLVQLSFSCRTNCSPPRWFRSREVEVLEASHLDIILYSTEQLQKVVACCPDASLVLLECLA